MSVCPKNRFKGTEAKLLESFYFVAKIAHKEFFYVIV